MIGDHLAILDPEGVFVGYVDLRTGEVARLSWVEVDG